MGRAISILFGLIAVPRIAEEVLKPLWKVLALPRPKVDEDFSLLLIGISLSMVAVVIGGTCCGTWNEVKSIASLIR